LDGVFDGIFDAVFDCERGEQGKRGSPSLLIWTLLIDYCVKRFEESDTPVDLEK